MTNPSRSRLATTAAACTVVVAGMVGMSFAAVPLYEMFCRVTGFDGTPQRATVAPDHVLERTITVRFDGNIGNGLGWSFRPKDRQVTIKLGETAEVHFIAENLGREPSAGTATFNVTPEQTGIYFNKLDCFCFTRQVLKAGERVEMPVVFFIDPALNDDKDLNYLHTITLSYTFFPDRTQPAPVAAKGERSAAQKL